MIEPVMLREIRRTGMVDLRFGHELVEIISGHEDEASSVEIKARDKASGEVYDLVAPALVAADGAASFVRDFLQVPLDGPKKVAHFINCYFRADIEKYVGEHLGILLFFGTRMPPACFTRWMPKDSLAQLQVPEEEWSTELYTAERCAERIRAGAGVPDLEVEVLSIGKSQWNAVVGRSLIAGRLLLTGDAAHMFPPTGGFGANTGMQGMHDAIWKLALFLKGPAGRKLLRTYGPSDAGRALGRRPILSRPATGQ